MAKKLAVLFGVIFLIVGILGFIPNPLVGSMGLFEANGIHNLVHILIGVILLIVASAAPAKSALWLKIFGVVYLLVAIIGLLTVPNGGSILGLVATNVADHWLHVVLGVVLLVAGFACKSSAAPAPAAAMPTVDAM